MTDRENWSAEVIVLDDCETFNGLGDDQDQALLTIRADGAVTAYDLSRFLRDHMHLLRTSAYRMPMDHAIKVNALDDVAECLGMDVDMYSSPIERVVPPSGFLKI